jgi:anti-anti-sigma factor
MSDSRFEVSVARADGGSVIRLVGDLDNSSRPDLDAAYETARRQDGAIVLDFESAGFIDSSGIAAILRFLRRAREEGRAVSASGLSPHYREVFEITRISDFMTLPARAEERSAGSQARDILDERKGGS